MNEVIKNGENLKKYIIFSFLTFCALTPYLLTSFALINISDKWGSILFENILYFVAFPTGIMFTGILFNRNKIEVSGIKDYIAHNSRKIYLVGVVVFYLALFAIAFINIGIIIVNIMILIFSIPFLVVSFFMLTLVRKILKIMEELPGKEILISDLFNF